MMLGDAARWLFDPSGLTPHGFCLLWEPGLIWTHAIADLLIALTYFSIPAALAVFARRRTDLVFRPLFWLFAAFILLCGAEHLLEVLTLWVPAYGAQGVVKVATAVVSAITAIALWRLMPQALALPSPAQFQRAHAALQASEARHRANFERSPVPLHTLDADGRITAVSDSWLSLLGYQASEVIGRPIRDFGPSWKRDELERLYAHGELRDFERQYVHRNGSTVETLVSARLEQSEGRSWIACVLVDISARRKAEAALNASEERLRQSQKMESVGQLTGGIAHDFNNMLQGITGGLDLMERRIAQGRADEAGRYVAMARQSVDRAAGLTHRMLAFARRQALEPRAVEPASLVLGMEELIRRTLGPAIALVLQLDRGVWHARCDANQLESALLNLAINARDAMPKGGKLTITTADRDIGLGSEADELDLKPGDYVEIAIADTGSGMPPEVLARAFEPFFTTKPTGQGTGLGLSQLYGFARQSGGAVQIESVLGEGTIVRLSLPRDAAPGAPTAYLPGETGVRRVARGTVLLVEDEVAVRAVASEVLHDLGCRVLEAVDGPAGLRVLQSREPVDLLITDLGLPGINGRQLADAARDRCPDLPVLLITGYTGAALDGEALAPGVQILRKPFTVEVLAARVCAMLESVMVGSG